MALWHTLPRRVGVGGTHTMRTLHKEANAKPRVNNFAKNDVMEGVGVGGWDYRGRWE